MTLRPQGGGDDVASNDDRGSALANTSGNALDPLLVATIPAGDYELEVENRTGAGTDFDLAVAGLTTELPLGTQVDGTVPAGGVWAGYVTVPSDGAYRVDVKWGERRRRRHPDPILVMIGPDGEQLINDDRADGDADPLLEDSLTAGTWVVLVTDYRGRSIDMHTEISPA